MPTTKKNSVIRPVHPVMQAHGDAPGAGAERRRGVDKVLVFLAKAGCDYTIVRLFSPGGVESFGCLLLIIRIHGNFQHLEDIRDG